MFCLRAPQFNRSFHSWLLKPSTVSVCSLILSMFIELNWDTVAWLLPLHIMIHQNAFQHLSAMGGWELVALIGEVSKLQQHPESSEIGNARATLREKARKAGITQKTLLGLAYCGGCQRTNWCLWALLWRINGAQCCTIDSWELIFGYFVAWSTRHNWNAAGNSVIMWNILWGCGRGLCQSSSIKLTSLFLF